ncbi:NACHT domain-containing protein [Streptomyces xanthophaeus]|uniref:NACHT domain-containing protein n=1 Tax=Streptomyces xanthophaeus TaxID=67385 RepID=UPI00233E573C|nr:NACHT domain-containing protein [Streptomyces xanthophaeus]
MACLLALAAMLVLTGRRVARKADDQLSAGLEGRALVAQRKALRGEVEQQWVHTLHASLENTVRVELGFAEQPDAVADPWASPGLREWGRPQPMPAGTKLIDVYRQCSQRLLVLGRAGSGKTTQLLSLTRDLLPEPEDVEEPLPVVLLLSRWTGGDFRDWVANELEALYRVRGPVAAQLLEEGGLTLILDGLDEVRPQIRGRCIQAIDHFMSADQCPLTGVVVSCRIDDYADAGEQLALHSAVELTSLKPEAVHRALREAGQALDSLHDAAVNDETLTELLDTPLMLGVAVLAYRDSQVDAALVTGSLHDRRGHLFDAYVSRMLIRDRALRRRPLSTAPYEPTTAWQAITRLARIMKRLDENILYPRDPLRQWSAVSGLYYMILFRRWRPASKVITFLDIAIGTRGIKVWRLGWSWPRYFSFTALGMVVGMAGILPAGSETSAFAWAMAAYCALAFGAISGLAAEYAGTDASRDERRSIIFGAAVRWVVLAMSALGPLMIYQGRPWGVLLLTALSFSVYLGWVRLRARLIPPLVRVILGCFLHVRLKRFLAYADDRALMRRAGDGYQYLHATMLEHLAHQVDKPLPEPPSLAR